jgi:hypothetical protein
VPLYNNGLCNYLVRYVVILDRKGIVTVMTPDLLPEFLPEKFLKNNYQEK